LFSTPANSVLTLATLWVLYWIRGGLARWLAGAFWEPIWANRKLFATGIYPSEQLWQPAVVLLLVCALFGLSAGRWGSIMRTVGIGLAALLLLLALIPLGEWRRR
jgi:general L-amino acid transport system permease protein